MGKKIEVIKNIVLVFLLFILLMASLLTISQRKGIVGYSSYTVLSGSMNPEFNTGDVVISKKVDANNLVVGDIIVFSDPNIPGKIITHRVVKVTERNNQKSFETKGDANSSSDGSQIQSSSVQGKVIFHISKIGFLIGFAKTLPGLILLILLPGFIIIISEMMSLAKHLKKIENKSKQNEQVQP